MYLPLNLLNHDLIVLAFSEPFPRQLNELPPPNPPLDLFPQSVCWRPISHPDISHHHL
jgi:hypothetical protein